MRLRFMFLFIHISSLVSMEHSLSYVHVYDRLTRCSTKEAVCTYLGTTFQQNPYMQDKLKNYTAYFARIITNRYGPFPALDTEHYASFTDQTQLFIQKVVRDAHKIVRDEDESIDDDIFSDKDKKRKLYNSDSD